MTVSLGLLAFWELWGRQNLSYDSVAVFKEAVPRGTVISSDMLHEKKVEKAEENALLFSEAEGLYGMESAQYIPAGEELYKEFFQNSQFAVGKDKDRYILSIPDHWLSSYPQTLKRGDRAFFYCSGEIVTDAVVAYVKDSVNKEVTFENDSRLAGSAQVSLIEVIVSREQAVTLGKLADKGNKFVIMYY